MWTSEPVNVEADVKERARQLKARIKDLQNDRSARDLAADSPLPSFASIQTPDAAITADKSRVTEIALLTSAATSPPPELSISDLLSADYYYDAQDD